MGSIKQFSLPSQTEFQNPKLRFGKLNPVFSNPLGIRRPQSLSLQLCRLRIFPNLSQSHIPSMHTSNIRRDISSHLSTKTEFVKVLSEKVVIFLVGSFIFMGHFNARPRLALAAETSSSSENLEEKTGARKEKDEDEEMYDKLLEKEPRNVDALKVALYKKMRGGKTKEALRYVEELIKIEPEEFEWKLLEALCYETMGELNKATRLFKEILKDRPIWIRALHGLAMAMQKNHEGPAVFEMLNKALDVARHEKRVTDERNIRILIAQMHVAKGELEEGLKKFQDLVNDDPRDFRPYLCQGLIYGLLGKEEEAAEQFEIYQRLVPDEFPQRGFLDDLVFEARTKSQEVLRKELEAELSYKK
ncbi:hypothetical protein SLE2022_298610 [Rubroshorea leprosula]